MPTRRIIILAKPPLRGRAKSRLAKGVGVGRAARLARAMLQDTCLAVRRLTDAEAHIDAKLALADEQQLYPVLQTPPPVIPQGQGDLGQRMARLAAHALTTEDDVDVERVLLLGTDSPGLPQTHVLAALQLLDRHDVVLGPVDDGGFWCLGLRASAAPLHDEGWLNGLDWDNDATTEAVRARARALGLSVGEAPAWFDIDHAEDLPGLKRRLLDAAGRVAAAGTAPAPAPSTLRELTTEGEPLSVIIASLNEGEELDRCLDALERQPGPLEVIVADGGSEDGSALRAAARPGVHVCVTGPGRGRQLAAGAALATGERLLFLHADVALPPDGTRLVRAALDAPGAEAGAFVTRTLADPALRNFAGPLLRLADLRSQFTRYPYGDQALFVTRTAYQAVGGFRELPILEDYDLSLRLAARRPIARISTPVTVSGRRMQTRPIRSAIVLRVIPPLYRLGVDPARLAKLYRS